MRFEKAKSADGGINARPFRKQVHDHLLRALFDSGIEPKAEIKSEDMGEHRRVGHNPFALSNYELKCEGFVSILPRRGVRVTKLTVQDMRNILEIVGAVEHALKSGVFGRFQPEHKGSIQTSNSDVLCAVHTRDFDRYYKLNIHFHGTPINFAGDDTAHKTITPLKQQYHQIPQRSAIAAWEFIHRREHAPYIKYIDPGDRECAVALMRDSNWSFHAYEKFVRYFHFGSNDLFAFERTWHCG